MANQHYESITAHDNTRLHLGNSYDYSTHHHHQDGKTKLDLRGALEFPRMAHRQDTIATISSKTSQWLFETAQYARWHDRAFRSKNGGSLWIKGKPGAGKSTIMKSLVKHVSEAHPQSKTISFFFNARGERLEGSVEGMYRSLLYQMTCDSLHLESMISCAALEDYAKTGWPLELLKDLFREAVSQLSRKGHLICFVDALDEGEIEDDVRDMVRNFTELAHSTSLERPGFSVCFASRHYPNISVKLCEAVILEDQEGHRGSIARYVTSKLSLGNKTLERDLGSEILQTSAGVFLWVVLVVATLNKEADRGNRHRLREELQATPLRIHDLIRELVKKERDERLLPAVLWVLFSYEPLTPEELYSGIMVSTGQTKSDLYSRPDGSIDADVVSDFVKSSTKGLIEITIYGRVQFIHETVREYFLGRGMEELNPDLTARGKVSGTCHQRLARWCETYFQLACQHLDVDRLHLDAPERLRMRFWFNARELWPLLERALNDLLQHAESAARDGVIDMTIEKTVCSKAWLLFKSCRNRDPWCADAVLSKSTLLYVLAYEGCTSLVNAQLKTYQTLARETQQSLINAQSSNSGSALHVAVARGKQDVVQTLIDNGADINLHSTFHGTPLHVAVSKHLEGMVMILLQYQPSVCAIHNDNETPLRMAVRKGHLSIIRKLLHHNSQTFHRAGDGLTLRLAALHRKEILYHPIIHLLLNHGYSANADVGNGCVALHLVAGNDYIGHMTRYKILETLLSRGADVNAQCPEHGTALHIAVSTTNAWRDRTAELLLRHGADVDLFCGNHGTALNAALLHPNATQNRQSLLDTLVAHSKDLLNPIGAYGNVIETAGKMNDYEAMRAFKERGFGVQAEEFSESGPY